MLLLLTVLIIGCKTTKELPIAETVEPSGPQLIFVNYKITKTQNDLEYVEVIDKLIVAGQMKVNRNKIPTINNRYFQCIQLDHKEEVLHTDYFTNPLLKDVEYVDKEGQLGRKLIEVDSADLSIRLQLDPKARFILLSKVNDSKQVMSIIDL